jgi:nitroreductase
MGGNGNSVEVDVSSALDHLALAAVAEGLGTCWVGAFDAVAVKSLLGVPDDVKVVAMMTLGYPEKPDLNQPADPSRRKDEAEVFCENRYAVRK